MRKIFIVLSVLIFGTASIAFATPVNDLDANITNAVIVNDILPLKISRFETMPTISEDINIGSQTNESINIGSSFASQYKPSWLKVDSPSWWGWCPWFKKRWKRKRGGGENSAPVPEPATMLLFGSGLVGLAMFSRKKLKK